MITPLKVGAAALVVISLAGSAFAQNTSPRTPTSASDNPRLSNVESVRFLAALVDALISVHQVQQRYDALPTDDFVGRMTVLRLLSGETNVRRLALTPYAKSTDENVSKAAQTATEVYERYKAVFDGNVALYEQLVRILTAPHDLSDIETKALSEARITTSQLAATFEQLSDLLKDVATLAFAATIVEAPNDREHIALNMTANERDSLIKDLRQGFGDLEKQKTVRGVDIAAFVLLAQFGKEWRLAK